LARVFNLAFKGKFTWLNSESGEFGGITKAQLSMLIEGIDWRNLRWSNPLLYAGQKKCIFRDVFLIVKYLT
jgi:hypothetical protein